MIVDHITCTKCLLNIHIFLNEIFGILPLIQARSQLKFAGVAQPIYIIHTYNTYIYIYIYTHIKVMSVWGHRVKFHKFRGPYPPSPPWLRACTDLRLPLRKSTLGGCGMASQLSVKNHDLYMFLNPFCNDFKCLVFPLTELCIYLCPILYFDYCKYFRVSYCSLYKYIGFERRAL